MHSMRVKSRRWTRLEYERLVEQRVFQPGEHLELLDGVLERVTFANPETGYTIARVATERTGRSSSPSTAIPGWSIA